MKVERPATHLHKLTALLSSAKLSAADKPRVEAAIKKYHEWTKSLDAATGTPDQILTALVKALNEYKSYVEVDLIFDSTEDFLYRQKGQLKLDNTILEEFMPRLFDERLVPGFKRIKDIECGPSKCFAHMSFGSPFLGLGSGGVFVKTKDQDFSVTKPQRVTISDIPVGTDKFETDIRVSYFATEIKTNLDKTMFQEASMTASELKSAVPGARYILVCEYLDMSPIDTKLTPIDEVIILRKARRINSNVRSNYSHAAGRKAGRAGYTKFLKDNPIHNETLKRFIVHLQECFPETAAASESVVLHRGYF